MLIVMMVVVAGRLASVALFYSRGRLQAHFFLGFLRPNLITGLSGWRAPDHYVASSQGSPLPHPSFFLDKHRDIERCSAIQESACPGLVGYDWGSIVELDVPPDETPC